MDVDKQPGIVFQGILLANENFHRIPTIPKELNMDLNYNMSLNKSNDNYYNELTTILTCTSKENEEVLRLEFTYVGIFNINKDEENMEIKEYMLHHSPALIYPYIREHISNVTHKAGINPILLPPLNIVALIKDVKVDFE